MGGWSKRISFKKNPNLKQFFFLGGGGGLGGVRGGWVEGEMDEQTNKPKLICPFNVWGTGVSEFLSKRTQI